MANMNRRITAYEVVRRTLASMALPIPQSASGSTDSITMQMWALLTECGQELLDKHGGDGWEFFLKTHTITTVPGTLTYDLPSDFQAYVDATGWNNTARIPLIGPLSPQMWRLLQARQLGGTTLRMQYVIRADKIEFEFVPDDAQTLAIDYIGRGWVRDATVSTTYRDFVENDSDIVMYDPRLIISMLKYKFRQAKGFDANAAEEEYENALAQAKYNDKPKNDLRLSGRSDYPYLGYLNMPDTNYGGS